MSSHLNGHLETHINGKFECDLCKKIFKTTKTLIAHKQQQHTDVHKFVCDVCKKGFAFKAKYKVRE